MGCIMVRPLSGLVSVGLPPPDTPNSMAPLFGCQRVGVFWFLSQVRWAVQRWVRFRLARVRSWSSVWVSSVSLGVGWSGDWRAGRWWLG